MKQSSLSVWPEDYPDRPLKPSWDGWDLGHEEQTGSIESGLTCTKRFDGEDPRYAVTNHPGAD